MKQLLSIINVLCINVLLYTYLTAKIKMHIFSVKTLIKCKIIFKICIYMPNWIYIYNYQTNTHKCINNPSSKHKILTSLSLAANSSSLLLQLPAAATSSTSDDSCGIADVGVFLTAAVVAFVFVDPAGDVLRLRLLLFLLWLELLLLLALWSSMLLVVVALLFLWVFDSCDRVWLVSSAISSSIWLLLLFVVDLQRWLSVSETGDDIEAGMPFAWTLVGWCCWWWWWLMVRVQDSSSLRLLTSFSARVARCKDGNKYVKNK